jgi:23S rRNA pseudouridine1911/1915/1917 synthase
MPAADEDEIDRALAGQPLDRALRGLGARKAAAPSWNQVRRLIQTGKVFIDGKPVTDPEFVVRAGQRLKIVMHAPAPRARRLPEGTIVYIDSHVVVVEKPSGVSSVPFSEDERDALNQLLELELAQKGGGRRAPLGIVHRLDRDTTGLLVFARTLSAKRELKNQFRHHDVERRYWALVEGQMESTTITSRLITDRGDGRRGSVESASLGRVATTHVKALERLPGATLVECRLETGRTHQIRIHLGEEGHALLGERVYGARGRSTAPELSAPRVMLHAFELGFVHPATEKPLHFESKMPADMLQVLEGLRKRRPDRRL